MDIKKYIKRLIRFVSKGEPIVIIKPQICQIAPNNLLANRRALITGGTSGIGYAIAKAFIESGAEVIITGRDQSRLDVAVGKLSEQTNTNKANGVVLDNSKVDTMPSIIASCIEKYGDIDILVNNAGVLTNNFPNVKEEDFDKTIDTNLKGVFFLSQVLSKHMIEKGIKGNILNVASSSSLRPAISAYTLSKWGLRGLTMGLAKKLIKDGITVNGVAPGPTATPMLHQDTENIYNKNIPLGRYVMPEEIANISVVLCSNMGKAILGDIVYVTGGAGILTLDDVGY